MNCVICQSSNILERKAKTSLGYQQYHCRSCGKYFNERTGTVYNFIQYPTDVMMLAIFFYSRYKLSLVNVSEMMMLRGLSICHETIRTWVQTCGVDVGLKIRKKRWKNVGKKWHMDITYLFLENRWCYLYRAIDKTGNLIDVYLSDERNTNAATKFFKRCHETTGLIP